MTLFTCTPLIFKVYYVDLFKPLTPMCVLSYLECCLQKAIFCFKPHQSAIFSRSLTVCQRPGICRREILILVFKPTPFTMKRHCCPRSVVRACQSECLYRANHLTTLAETLVRWRTFNVWIILVNHRSLYPLERTKTTCNITDTKRVAKSNMRNVVAINVPHELMAYWPQNVLEHRVTTR